MIPVRRIAYLIVLTSIVGVVRGEDDYFETQVKLQTPKKDDKRSQEGGLEHAPFRLWLPSHVQTIRGVVFNPFYTRAVTQEHWQAACRQWEFGILASNFFGVKQSEFPQVVDLALSQFAEKSGHAELVKAKFCPVGMSAGAGMCVKLAELMPDRVIAAGPVCLEVGPKNEESMKIPILTIFGERDGRQYEKLAARLPEVRAQGARFGIAVQWRRKHEFGRANNVLLPLFDAAIRKRLGEPGQPLREFEESAGWLGEISNWKEGLAMIAPVAEYQKDKSKACWLPDGKTAHTWQAFVTYQPQLQLKSPPGLGDDQTFVLHRVGESITIEMKSNNQKRLSKSIDVYAGDQKLGQLEDGKLEIQFDKPGIYPLFLRTTGADGSVLLSRPNTILVEARRVRDGDVK